MTSPWDDRRDRQLLARVAGGDREALAELYDCHATALFGYAVALARSRADAEDLVQGAFVKLAGMGAPLLGIRSPGAYLHTMVRMAFLDGERHRAVAADEPLGILERGRTDAASSPGVSALEAPGRLALEAALARLPAAQREAVVLHAVEGLTFREVARVIGVSTWTAASRYRVALGRLRQILGTRR